VRYRALACDYDGTLASHGRVDRPTLEALERLRASGRKLVLVTGRQVADLLHVFPRAELFDRVVAENGAVIYSPPDRGERSLAQPPPSRFVAALRKRGVIPLSVGRVIVATEDTNERIVRNTIHQLGLELQVISNKGAIMVLPPGVDKATGLEAALPGLNVSRDETVGVGDAENDHSFLRWCGCSVAVANALLIVKQHADLITRGDHGAGVIELVDRLLTDDLADVGRRLLY
jgi:hydroxymethylpyrimidine pyrophosphatase-like HAD family hydrolase